MGKGQEYVKRVQEALDGFEKAVVRRENKGLMESKVALQQEVDRAREHVLEVVAKIVAEERLRAAQ
jgi:hypothetical protein